MIDTADDLAEQAIQIASRIQLCADALATARKDLAEVTAKFADAPVQNEAGKIETIRLYRATVAQLDGALALLRYVTEPHHSVDPIATEAGQTGKART